MLKEVSLVRYGSTPAGTFGRLYVGGGNQTPLYTLEPPWRGNMTGESCIPLGTYTANWRPTATTVPSTFHGMTWRLSDVVDRKSIVIHVGNSKKDTEGCILLGMAQGVLRHKWAITSSMQAMLTLLEIVGPNSLTIDITAAPCG